MKINSLTVSYADIGRLLAAIEKCGATPPKQLTDVLQAHEKLTAASPIPDPVKTLVTAALDGRATAEKVDKLLEQTAVARLTAEERRGLQQRVEPELLKEFGRRLEDTGADAVLDLLRPQFDEAATTLGSALAIAGVPDDAAAFLASASAEQLHCVSERCARRGGTGQGRHDRGGVRPARRIPGGARPAPHRCRAAGWLVAQHRRHVLRRRSVGKLRGLPAAQPARRRPVQPVVALPATAALDGQRGRTAARLGRTAPGPPRKRSDPPAGG